MIENIFFGRDKAKGEMPFVYALNIHPICEISQHHFHPVMLDQ